MEQIFNELSLSLEKALFSTKEQANTAMENFLNLSKKLSDKGFNNHLRVTRDFSQLLLANNYTIYQWATEKGTGGAQKERQRKLLSIASKAPFIDELIDQEMDNELIEFQFNECSVYGLGLAYLWGGTALSFLSCQEFNAHLVPLEIIKLTNDECYEASSDAYNVASEEHVDIVANEIQENEIQKIASGEELYKRHEDVFPHIKFSPDVEPQVLSLTGSEKYFGEIKRHLRCFDLTANIWNGGKFKPQGITSSPETKQTLRKYDGSRDFTCLDGEKRTFSEHSKLMSSNIRIHYFFQPEDKIVLIGYIGKHLPTVKNPT